METLAFSGTRFLEEVGENKKSRPFPPLTGKGERDPKYR